MRPLGSEEETWDGTLRRCRHVKESQQTPKAAKEISLLKVSSTLESFISYFRSSSDQKK